MAAKPKLTLKLSAKDRREAEKLKRAIHSAMSLVADSQIRAELLIQQYATFIHKHLTT